MAPCNPREVWPCLWLPVCGWARTKYSHWSGRAAELFTLLAGHAATAIFSAKLYSTSARKLTTLQGFLELLKQPGR